MTTFNTAFLDGEVARFKTDLKGREDLFLNGQFYISNQVQGDILTKIKSVLSANPRLNPQQVDSLMGSFRSFFEPGVDTATLVLGFLNIVETNFGGDYTVIRAMFAPGPTEKVWAESIFQTIWTDPNLGPTPLVLGPFPNLRRELAAIQVEDDKCYVVANGFASFLLRKRKIAALAAKLRISDGQIAGASLSKEAGKQQTIVYRQPAALPGVVSTMKAARSAPISPGQRPHAGSIIRCGVLSGALHEHSVFPNPEHYVLALANDRIEGKEAFLFWDPDAAVTEITSTGWGRGFGCLFGSDQRLSTAIDDADLMAIDTDRNSLHFGEHLNEPRRKRYQVYSVQTLPS